MKKDSIRISSARGKDFSTEITIGKEKCFVQTEAGSPRNPVVITQVYLKGQIIRSRKTPYETLADGGNRESMISELMTRQHRAVIDELKAEASAGSEKRSVKLERARTLLEQGKGEEALLLIEETLVDHPEDPFLLSYRGYLVSAVKKKHKTGVTDCLQAIEALKSRLPFGREFFYPELYINLGKAYLAAGRKRDAVDAFHRALSMDQDNRELMRILKELGIRRSPPIPLLDRSNIINRYVGLLLQVFSRKKQ